MMRRNLIVVALSLLFTHVFFIEYRAGEPRVRIPYDLEGFHYPLADYAFQSLRDGRIPEWDPTMYSGLPFVANVQAAFFYPPTWLLFATNYGNPRMRYETMQDAVFLHVWLAFMFTWLWFRWKRLDPIAAVLGAGVFSFSGYVMHQLQHFGLIAGYAWLPLGFWAVDQVHAERRWLPAWKLVIASAMCFLAGYTPFWIVFVICMFAYALARPSPFRAALTTAIGIGISVLLCAVQLLPAIEASGSMVRDYRYGWGFKDPLYYLSYLVPNYFDFEFGGPVATNPGYDLLYLGGMGIAGVLLAFAVKRALRQSVPALGVLLVCAFFVTNPFGVVSSVLLRWPLGAQLIRDYYFLGGVTPAIAMLAAAGLHEGLSRQCKPARWANVAAAIVAASSAVWSVRLLLLWKRGAPSLARGDASIADGIAAVLLASSMILLYSRSCRRLRVALTAAMVLLTAAEYKAFGTSKRVNTGESGPSYVTNLFPGMDDEVYRRITSRPDFRSAIDEGGPFTTDLRHGGITTPQGFDPLLPANYRRLIESLTTFRTDREFEFDPSDEDTLRLFGVRYFITIESSPRFPQLQASSSYKLLESSDSHFEVFELVDAQPAYGWEPITVGDVHSDGWSPERRRFTVNSESGGTFRLSEQYFPGWSALIDGSPVKIELCHTALQCVSVPPGVHEIEFRYRSRPLRIGAIISLLSCAGFLSAVWLFSSDPEKLGNSRKVNWDRSPRGRVAGPVSGREGPG